MNQENDAALAAPKPAARTAKPKATRKPHRAKPRQLTLRHLGPIQRADVSFGDLTVIVGPQATGKSIFLQTLKLLIDRDQIHDMFKHHSMSFNGHPEAFLDGYYGRGMASAWSHCSFAYRWLAQTGDNRIPPNSREAKLIAMAGLDQPRRQVQRP